MGVGGELACEVAEVVLDLSEGLVVGEIDEVFGHLPEGGLGLVRHQAEEGLETGFTVIGGLQRRRSGRR